MIFLERHSGGDDLPAVTSYSVMEESFCGGILMEDHLSVVMLRWKMNYSRKYSGGRWSMRVGMMVDYDLLWWHFLEDDLSVMAVCVRYHSVGSMKLTMRIYISKIITMNNINLRTNHIAYNMLILFITKS
jgi:hypothetical protein